MITSKASDLCKDKNNYFDEFAEYNQAIRKWVPCYDEMLNSIVFYTPDENVNDILDLGCGSGNLVKRIIEKFPEASVNLVDISSRLLHECKARFNHNNHINFLQKDFRYLTFPESSLDLVVSSIAIHHLTDMEKQQLFNHIFSWLKPGGMLCYADIFRSGNQKIDEFHYRIWHKDSSLNGASESDWNIYLEHEKSCDYPSVLKEHLALLQSIGFHDVYCPWKYSFWSQIIAYKN